MSETTILFDNARLLTGERGAILVRDGRIAAIGEVPDADAAERFGLAGLLVVPGFVDGHLHLDKTLLGGPWQPHRPYTNGFSVAERVRFEKAALRAAAPVAERAAALLAQVVGHGTTALRTHVDIDPEAGLSNLEAVLALRERSGHLATIQVVAFPQSGILAAPGTADLLAEALRSGADLIGGLDPATLDRDVTAHLDCVFGLAERHGVGIDIHLHDGGEAGIAEIEDIAARTKALGMGGRVAISHAFALGDVPPDAARRTADALARAGVAIMTHAPGHRAFPPILLLRERGVRVFCGNDNIRDAWRPYGSGDMLERAMLVGYRSGFVTDDELAVAFDLATGAAAAAIGLSPYGLSVGAPADFVALRADGIPDAVATQPSERWVFKAGRLVARDGRLLG